MLFLNFAFNRLAFVFIFLFTGCQVTPDFVRPDSPNVDRYAKGPKIEQTESSNAFLGESQTFLYGQELQANWWELFDSDELDQLIKFALKASPTVWSAEAKLGKAIENANAQQGASLFPRIDLQGSTSAYGLSSSSIHFSSPSVNKAIPNEISPLASLSLKPPTRFLLSSLSANVSYYLDLFGLEKRKTETFYADIEYQYYERYAVRLTLISNLIATAFTEASFRSQIQSMQEMIRIYEAQLDIMDKRLTLGDIAQLDVSSKRQRLEQIKAESVLLEKSLKQTRNQLALYAGMMPTDACLPEFYLESFRLPLEIPLNLPSELARQRPDILLSEAKVHKANAELGIAIAHLFPQINLTGSYGPFELNARDFLRIDTLLWSLGGSFSQPLFHGKELLSKKQAALANLQASLADYLQTVLQGFQNVADALQALESDSQVLKFYASALDEAKISFEIIQKQFDLGGTSYFRLLEIEKDYYEARLNAIQAQSARLLDTATLFYALGGWKNRLNER